MEKDLPTLFLLQPTVSASARSLRRRAYDTAVRFHRASRPAFELALSVEACRGAIVCFYTSTPLAQKHLLDPLASPETRLVRNFFRSVGRWERRPSRRPLLTSLSCAQPPGRTALPGSLNGRCLGPSALWIYGGVGSWGVVLGWYSLRLWRVPGACAFCVHAWLCEEPGRV